MGVLWLGSRLSSESSGNRQIERELGTLIIYSGTVLGAISSPLSEKETILWEETNRLGYNYDILWKLWGCESQFRHQGIWGRDGEYGAFQFMPKTFKSYADYYGMDEANWFSFEDQAKLTILMLKDNLGYHWTCWSKI